MPNIPENIDAQRRYRVVMARTARYKGQPYSPAMAEIDMRGAVLLELLPAVLSAQLIEAEEDGQ